MEILYIIIGFFIFLALNHLANAVDRVAESIKRHYEAQILETRRQRGEMDN